MIPLSEKEQVAEQFKCFEFKLYLNSHQRRKIDHWLRLQNWVWNRGLALIEWREWLNQWDLVLACGDIDGVEPTPLQWVLNPDPKAKKDDKWVLACSRVKWRKYDPQTDKDGWVEDGDHYYNPITGCWREALKNSKGGDKRYIVAMPGHEQVKEHWGQDCPLQDVRPNPYFDLVSQFPVTKWRHVSGDCPSKFVAGTLKSLADSWKAYRKGIRARPRFKGKRNRIATLIHPNSKGNPIKDGKVSIPNLGYVKARGLDRWDGQPYCPMKICKRASGYYIQLTYPVDAARGKDHGGRIVAIDPGGVILAADDQGHQFAPADVARLKARLLGLQQKASRQYRANRAEIKNGDRITAHVDKDKNWKRRNLTKTYQAMGRLHEKIGRKRLAHAHFVADRVVSMGDVIVIEDCNWQNMKTQNKAKLDKKGNFKNNRAKSKAGLIKKLSDASPGLLKRLILEKAKERNRTVLLAPAVLGMSGICAECGHNHHKAVPKGVTKEDYKQLWRPTQDLFYCQACGHQGNADTNAAQNLKAWGEQVLRGTEGVERYLPGAKPKRSTAKGRRGNHEYHQEVQ